MKEVYVVFNYEGNGLYLTGEITSPGLPTSYQWGNVRDAIEYETLEQAQDKAAAIGGGTVGTTRP